jgi:large subunit ribosomal protein L29
MNVGEIRALRTEEIQSKMDEAHKSLFNMRFQAAVGQLEDFNRMRAIRRDIARMKTILRERELAASPPASGGSQRGAPGGER